MNTPLFKPNKMYVRLSFVVLLLLSIVVCQIPDLACTYVHKQSECLKSECKCIWCESLLTVEGSCVEWSYPWNVTSASSFCPLGWNATTSLCPESTQILETVLAWVMVVSMCTVIILFPVYCIINRYIQKQGEESKPIIARVA